MEHGDTHDPQLNAENANVSAQALTSLTNLANIISESGQQEALQPAGELHHAHGHPHDDQEDGTGQPAAKRARMKAEGEGGVEIDEATAAAHAAQDVQAAAAQAAAHANGDMAATAGDINLLDMQAAMMSGNFNPEQMAALGSAMQMTPEMLAAAMQPGPDGQPVSLPMLPDMNGFLDPATLQMTGGIPQIPGMDVLQQLPPEQLQAFLSQQGLQHFFMPPGGFGMPQTSDSNPTYKNWWDEKDEGELMRMVSDTAYRTEKLGTDELDWAKLETYFDRSQNALRKKFWMLSKRDGGPSPDTLAAMGLDPAMAMASAAAAAAAAAAIAAAPPVTVGAATNQPRPRAERKNWSEEETAEMKRCVQDPMYRAALGLQDGEEEVSWERLATKFMCSMQTAKRKFRHLQEQATQFNGLIPDKGKRQHFRKSVPYRWMIVSALSKIPGFEATAPQIFENIENDVELRQQLDMRIMPGTKHVPRWKIQVRKVLSADHIFINTGVKQKHETIWRLDPIALTDANADRQRQRAGVPPINLQGTPQLPSAPPLANTDEAMAAMLANPHMQLNEQTMAMLQQQHMQLMGMQQHQLQMGDVSGAMLGLEGGMLDPATLAALTANVGATDAHNAYMAAAAAAGDADAMQAAVEQQAAEQHLQQHQLQQAVDAVQQQHQHDQQHQQIDPALWAQHLQQAGLQADANGDDEAQG